MTTIEQPGGRFREAERQAGRQASRPQANAATQQSQYEAWAGRQAGMSTASGAAAAATLPHAVELCSPQSKRWGLACRVALLQAEGRVPRQAAAGQQAPRFTNPVGPQSIMRQLAVCEEQQGHLSGGTERAQRAAAAAATAGRGGQRLLRPKLQEWTHTDVASSPQMPQQVAATAANRLAAASLRSRPPCRERV